MFRLFIFFMLVGCASVPKLKKINKKLFDKYDGKISYEDAKSDLEASFNNMRHNYTIRVYPYTKYLVSAEHFDQGRVNMEKKLSIMGKVKKDIDLFVKNKNCFMVYLETFTIVQGKFQNWKFKLKSQGGKLKNLKAFNVKGVESVPKINNGMGRKWVNASVVCGDGRDDLSNGFVFYAIPQLENPRGEANARLIWGDEKGN
jgi:hypothetical protein